MGKPAAPTSVEAVKHSGDRRMNIPTAEMGTSIREPAQAAPQVLRYPRDPSLDPQLVWKGPSVPSRSRAPCSRRAATSTS
ncbi:MAG: hypothetical protein ABSE70_10960 [Candidatus Limnocylindrales bacterium]